MREQALIRSYGWSQTDGPLSGIAITRREAPQPSVNALAAFQALLRYQSQQRGTDLISCHVGPIALES